MLFDAHLHLIKDNGDWETDVEAYFSKAKKNGVEFLFNNSTSLISNFKTLELAEKFSFIVPGFGIYPLEFKTQKDLGLVDDVYSLIVAKVLPKFGKRFFIGEIGLDYKYGAKTKELQKEAFRRFLSIAKDLDVFVEVHSRWAIRAVFNCIDEIGHKKVVMHWFLFEKYSKEAMDRGFYITIGPWYLLNREKNKKILMELEPERILFETDFPVAYGGIENTSDTIAKIFEAVCEDLDIEREKMLKLQEKNFKILLNIY